MTQKEVYPYEYIDFFEQFQEPQLPPKDTLYSSLTEEEVSETDCTHAQRVFNYFDMTDLGKYYNFYLLTNVLLLGELFENFRDLCLQHYGLDPAHNYTCPGLSWQAAFKITDVELDLLPDIDQHLFMEEGISHQYVQANTPRMENYDTRKGSTYILYLDANNLNGWAMTTWCLMIVQGDIL